MISIDFSKLCLGCMNILPHPKATCPNCGWSRNSSQNNTLQLQQDIILENPNKGNEYLIGRALGNGGFGIVYIAWDKSNNRKVAVKEYFPAQFVARTQASTVVLQNDSQSNRDFYEKQKKRFRQEAVKMQMFNDNPNVVNVFDYFEQNNTAYIVMEFIEGQTFLQFLAEQNNSRIDFPTAVPGEPPTGIIKEGYSPYEQTLTVGVQARQEPWTDVYALAATIYRAITGQLPPKSADRSNIDTIILPSAFGISITPQQEQILMKGLAVKYPNRYQSVRQFYTDLYNSIVNPPPQPILQVGKFERDGDNYRTSINYNGDGILSTNFGMINGNFLIIPKTEIDGKGGVNGTISASQGNNYAETSITFYCPEIKDGKWNKILWGLAIVACGVTFLFYNKLDTKEKELSYIKQEVRQNLNKLEKYREFAQEYGYGSEHYYAEKAIVFLNKNSKDKLSIYCDLLFNNKSASCNFSNNEASVYVEWEDGFNNEHKANLIINSGNIKGYSTLKFTNEVNSDSFEVLIIVR